ncbi:DUF817 domain-containing protein [Cytobacillus spongiae]|jgi:uncharacterized membrane protein YoaT (DUF817 family)|uniref:DUF817 domain-containing protein n=1 Tax=Cytobacillus spongiae TaxID=2901381 RepID=UPI001F1DE571|nr:DUF817 domain-containing protein [Cytobacillus spongiae]UII55309.1 DUF817 domain-containing protein [Cytobacillus spongiae]
MKYLKDLLTFTYLQALSCIFPVIIFLTLGLSTYVKIPGVGRYDFILLICIIAQVFMIISKLETIDELKVICVFHLIGLALEIYKVHMGSWSYPEEAWSKIAGVPLYSGFMYASVASYMCQSWRRMSLRITGWPNLWLAWASAVAVYGNFFTHHYIYDFRWILKAVIVMIFFRSYVLFTLRSTTYRMPVPLSFVLIGFFIWIAENIATFYGAWQYPNQQDGWQLVHFSKISSWLLLVIVSFIIVAQLKHVKQARKTISDQKEITQ